MASYKTQAIIINRLNLGESDRILTLFSPEYGKIRAICKGSRKTKSKFGGHTELFTLADFIITSGKSLDIVSEATLLTNYLNNNPDIENIKTAYYFGEIINKLLPDETPNPDIYEVLTFCLGNIGNIDEKLLQLIFVAKILKTLGIYPELSSCIKCEEKPDKEILYFSKTGGGLVDKSCSLHFHDAIRTDESTIKLWRYVTETPLQSATNISAPKATIDSACELANSYILCVASIDVKSLRVLA